MVAVTMCVGMLMAQCLVHMLVPVGFHQMQKHSGQQQYRASGHQP